jgi:CRISPR-associated protein Cmr1
MRQLEYTLQFTTPAFLGNAEQSAQWRTPPIKALLRQWWRVAYAAEHGFNVKVADMRREEGLLFGHAWLEDDTFERDGRQVRTAARKSQVRIRLDTLSSGDTSAWKMGGQAGVAPLATDLSTSYAWFGLVNRGAGQPDKTAIKADNREGMRLLRIACPEQHEARIVQVIRLIHAFGQIGSRSRGGWGSFAVPGVQEPTVQELIRLARPIAQCLEHDWAMSFARDSRGLCVWRGRTSYPTWDRAMRALAAERRTVRTALKDAVSDLRPALGFAGSGRMPSPLRWKVLPNRQGQLTIRVFAIPHKLPKDSGKSMNPTDLMEAWTKTCEKLDASQLLTRVTE